MKKIAAITGGGRGIGFELAQQFCSKSVLEHLRLFHGLWPLRCCQF
jgi:NADP-dependent 3-hydroxy acid dehydrogenase YdfG